MEKKLILIRHGQTDWNLAGKFQGQQDIPLNDEGNRQALEVAKYLADEEIAEIYSSDLQRAYKTALKIAEYQQMIKIKTLPDLREINFGQWEGLTYRKIEREYPERLKKWYQTPVKTTPPGGESIIEFQKRVVEQLTELCQQSEGKKIVVVAHGGTIRVFLAYILKMPLNLYWKLEVDHCRITIVKHYSGEFTLKVFNNPCRKSIKEDKVIDDIRIK